MTPEPHERQCSELSLITGVHNRIKFLGWKKNYIPSLVSAERRYELSEYSNRQKRAKGTRKRISTNCGIWCCPKCRVVFEISRQWGSNNRRLALDFYEHVCRLGKAKKECPRCEGNLGKFRVFGGVDYQ